MTGEKFYAFDFVDGDVELLKIFKNIKSDIELKQLPEEKDNPLIKGV